MATNRFVCEVCNKGFQRDQNLQLHRRGHNLPWKLKQRASTDIRTRVYVCPEPTCVHHEPSRALGDLTGIKKHYYRKHGEKKWKCERCSKRYAVQSDWKAHVKICGTREYQCDCGTIFSRKDSFITHRAFCDALAEENSRVNRGLVSVSAPDEISTSILSSNSCSNTSNLMKSTVSDQIINNPTRPLSLNSLGTVFSSNSYAIFSPNERSLEDFSSVNGLNTTHLMSGSGYMSATALLQKATEMGSKVGGNSNSISPIFPRGFAGYTPIMRSFGLTQEVPSDSSFRCFDASTGSSANRNVGAVSANNGLYIDQNGFEKNMQGVNSDLSPGSTVLQSEFLYHSLLIQTENQNSANFMGGLFMELQKSVHQGIAEGEGGEKMTVDFLGLGPISRLDVMERPMWNF